MKRCADGLRSMAKRVMLAVVVPTALHAQPGPSSPVANVVQFAAQGIVETPSDWLTFTMSTTREGSEAAAVQAQLRSALDAALAEAKRTAQPGLMDIRTGNFSLYPRHGRDGKLTGWQGSAELILEGRDFSRVSTAAGRLQTLSVAGVSFGLSREQRLKLEGEAQAMAIERFRSRAMEIARGFGFAAYDLREVSVSASDPVVVPRPRLMGMEARAAMADAPVPVEPGKTLVVVTVSGSVQLK